MMMLEQSEIDKLKKAERDEITNIQISAVMALLSIRKDVSYFLKNTTINNKNLKILKKTLIQNYSDIFLGIKNNIIAAYNNMGDIQTNTYEQFKIPLPKLIKLKTLPKTKKFKITNRILNTKSIVKRSNYLSDRVIKIIDQGFKANLSIKDIQKKLDIELGYRNKHGVITEKSKNLIKSGKFSHANGNIYQTYRIARTEVMRASAARTYEIFDGLNDNSKRLKLIATIDNRTREQSAQMNGQISDSQGRFKYPDGNMYRLGFAPAQWSINDRETAAIVFLTDNNIKNELEVQNKIRDVKIDESIDNILPKLNKDTINKINLVNKDVLLKRNILERNSIRHPDIKRDNYNEIIGTLYKYNDYFRDINKTNYIHFIRNLGNINYVVLLDVTDNKKYFEIVHFHKINDKNLNKLINKNKK